MSATLSLDITDTLAHGVFPERRDQDEPLHDRWARGLLWRARRLVQPPLARMRSAATEAEGLATRAAALAHVCRPSQKLSKHQADAPKKFREWHYIRVVGSQEISF